MFNFFAHLLFVFILINYEEEEFYLKTSESYSTSYNSDRYPYVSSDDEGKTRNCTLLVIGQTGAGKSELGNAYLENRNAFKADDSADSVTFCTSSKEKIVDGVNRIFIDTQGLDDTKGVDKKYIQQTVNFLRNWKQGVNAVAIVINGQAPRFDKATQKLIKYIHAFFNNTEFWNQTCIVFTRCYKENPVNEKRLSTEYKKKVQDIIMECIGNKSLNNKPKIPTFFTDSKKYDSDDNTKKQLKLLHEFAYSFLPLSTEHVVEPDYVYMRKEKEIKNKVEIVEKEKIIEEGDDKKKKIITYEDQEREKQWDYDNHESYSEWRMIKRWEEIKTWKKEKETQTRVLVSINRKEVMKRVKKKRKFLGFIKYKTKYYNKHDYWLVTRKYQDKERDVVIDFDGKLSYGDWKIIKEYEEASTE